MLLYKLAKPHNLLRLGLVVFLLTSLALRIPGILDLASDPPLAQAVTCSGGKCESAGHCWDQGTKAGNGDTGKQYVCEGGSWKYVSEGTSEQKAQAAALKKQYDDQVAASGGGAAAGGAATQTGVGVTGGAVCGSGSASGCAGKSFYSQPSGAPADWVCFPNGVNIQGVTLCGRGPASGGASYSYNTPSGTVSGVSPAINIVTDPNTGKPISGNVIATNQSQGGCGAVIQCGCPTGMQSLCMPAGTAPGDVAAYCAKTVCSPIGVNGKVCTPGQVKPGSCNGTMGEICNNSGTGYFSARAHACGATHTVAYCSNLKCYYSGGPTNPTSTEQCANYGGARCDGVTFNNEAQCEAATGAQCGRGVAQISQSISVATAYCTDACQKTGASNLSQCTTNCIAASNDPSNSTSAAFQQYASSTLASGACIPGGNYRVFKGCGSGNQSKYNCYQVCTNGVASTQCWNEPGLSCGAHQVLTPVQQALASVISTRTTVEPTPPPPTPTPTPTATCGQSCGSGVICTGSNMACVSGTCRSTLCSVDEQNSQCVCEPPPEVAPMCVDIFASKTNPALNDQVTFTCAQVDNAVRYEFRYAFTTKKDTLTGASIFELAPSSATSNVSQPITIDKVGRYVAQCRPCGPNDLCQEWEPLDGQIGPPELAPADAEIAEQETQQSSQTDDTQQEDEDEEEATESAQTTSNEEVEDETATESGTTQ